MVNYHRRREAAESVVHQIQEQGGAARAIQCDVSELLQHPRLVEAAMESWGRLDVLVNNAGITSPGRKDVLEATAESWDQVLATNLKGPFFLTQLCAADDSVARGRHD